MSWKEKAVALVKRFGAPAKFAAKLVLGAALPGGSALVDLVEKVLDCAHDTAKDNLEAAEAKAPAATAEELQRVAAVLDVLSGDLGSLTAKIASLEKLPQEASRTLEVALATDARCQAGFRRLDDLARRFDRLEEQNRQLLQGQGYAAGILDEMLPLMRRTAGVADFVEEMRSAGLTLDEFRKVLHEFQEAARALQQGRIKEAERKYLEVAKAQPRSAAAATALAAGQAADQNLYEAEKSLARAVRLRSDDPELAELHRQVTSATRHTRSQRAAGASSERKPPRVGDVLDGWRLELLLGRGGWGQVFKAHRGAEVVALKVMHAELANDPDCERRFRLEILTLGGLRGHKNLVDILDFGRAAGCLYFLTTFIDGVSLEQYLLKKGPLPVGQARPLFLAVAEGLAVAHARRVVHRDIKPANVLLAKPTGQPVLVDFGLATAAGSDLTRAGQSAGCTPMFAAPEQLHGKPADARSDVYSLAATLYYALLYDKHDLREPYCFEPEHAPKALRDLLTRSMHRRPEKRPANAAEFRSLLEGSGSAVVVPVKPQRKAGELYTNSLGMKFAWIPPGTFLMGSPPSEPDRFDNETQHKVTLTKGYWLGVHQVTQAQWQAVMGANPSSFNGDHLPVEQISWDDTVAFCEALGRMDGKTYRLPTEAEWEYACRAGTTTPFHFGSTISTDQANYNGASGQGRSKQGVYRQTTTAVGSFPANAWGLFDMHGNVFEWCADWYGPYEKGDAKDPQGASNGEDRVVRGGSWDLFPRNCRAPYRCRLPPGLGGDNHGCRVWLLDAPSLQREPDHEIAKASHAAAPVAPEVSVRVTARPAPLPAPAAPQVSARITPKPTPSPAPAPPPPPTRPQRKPSELFTNSLGMKFAWIPPGTFRMGSPRGEDGSADEKPQHNVTLTKGFWLGTQAVTQAQWRAVLGADPSRFKGGLLPVEFIPWEGAVVFYRELSHKDGRTYRLPTEAEWEYACRAGAKTAYFFGCEANALPDHAWYVGNSDGCTRPTGGKKPNAWGLYDMHGNVWEWCSDRFGPYPQHDAVDPQGPNAGMGRVVRGGSWNYGPWSCRSAYRGRRAPDCRSDDIGCRVVLCLD